MYNTNSKLLIYLTLVIISFSGYSQTNEERERIKSSYDASKAEKITQKIKKYSIQQEAAVKRLISQGYQKYIYNVDGTFDELVGVLIDGSPLYNSIDNIDSGIATRAADLHTGGSLGVDINGEGMVAYVWDGGRSLLTHQEFTGAGKITQADDASETPGLNPQSFHSTHVAGTLAANGGVTLAKGMAPQATIQAYVWGDEINEINIAGFNGALVSNHSYGQIEDTYPDWAFGAYVPQCYNYDGIMNAYEYYLYVTSAGNNGAASNDGDNAEPLNGNAAYDKLTLRKVLKNGLTVANGRDPQFDIDGNVISFTINNTSSEGPTDDLRIKPDITGIGTSVTSCIDSSDDAYNTLSGSSMASPTVAGTLLLLQQYYNNVNGNFMKANTLKGLALHTAIDGDGTVGPDAKAGWGLINAKAAADVITNDGTTSLIQELNLANGATYSIDVLSDGTQPLLTSISWFDVADTGVIDDGTSGANVGAKVLVNDLDVRVTRGGTTYYPWRLTGVATNANDGDNDRDPFERVDINNPIAGTYTITVSHKGTLPIGSGENYTLIVSGASSVLSVAENEITKFSIAPNPTQDEIKIKFSNVIKENVTITIVDVLGRNIFNKKYNSNTTDFEQNISLSDLNTGLYIVSIKQGDQIVTKKIIKE